VETAQESGKPELAEDLLRFFVSKNEKEYVTVCLYTCYEFVRPDVALELSWRFGLMDFTMPYFIQIIKELTHKVETVQKKHEDREKKEQKEASKQANQPLDYVNDYMNPLIPGQLMIANNNPMMEMGGMGMGMGMGMPGGFMGPNPGMGGFM
jgi:clathrin heavy chain